MVADGDEYGDVVLAGGACAPDAPWDGAEEPCAGGASSGAELIDPDGLRPVETGPAFTGPEFTDLEFTGPEFTGAESIGAEVMGPDVTGAPVIGPRTFPLAVAAGGCCVRI
jgi:hypothetical protein